ncbi:hypothetical protein MEQU1_002344 [Malassezia equina]|uniref:Sphingolipid long chain base-responsive protein LSP1 n=1 Tax=Malassezia equina TaxID=1381935 RepID=A0AAF0J454_9BASI|nr:hypothetical protein MEQU1_002344 [Malassezia equina]
MSLFKKAQSAVAHNSKIPQLGNSDLKPLQDLIHAEKLFVASNTKVAAETQNTADALRVWASGQGDDLEDVLPKVAFLYEHLSRAEARYNYYVSTMRLHLKSIRTREEKYAELKGRRRTLIAKIEGIERKLSKMGPENKDLAKVTSSLRELRSDMEVLNNEMAHEEAALGDYKRRTVAEALSLKSGGLMELAEKSIVVAESCRLLVEEIPLQPTMPGSQRAPYRNEARTNRLLQEAVRQLESIHFEPRESQLNVDRAQASPVSPLVAQPRPEGSEMGAGYDASQSMLSTKAAVPSATPGVPAHGMQLLDDREQGSQGWVAPEVPAPADTGSMAPGLPTVHESQHDAYEWEEPSRRYTNTAINPSQPDLYQYVPDTEANAMNDAIPSFPPVPPSAPAPAAASEVPLEDTTEDRAYFEGIGSTKALQEAAARGGGFPPMESYHRGPSDMYMPESHSHNFSPSSMRAAGQSMSSPLSDAPPPHLMAPEYGMPMGQPSMPPPSHSPMSMPPQPYMAPPPPSFMPSYGAPPTYAPGAMGSPVEAPASSGSPMEAPAPTSAPTMLGPATVSSMPAEHSVPGTAPHPSATELSSAPSAALPSYLVSQAAPPLEDARPQPAMPSSGYMSYMTTTPSTLP